MFDVAGGILRVVARVLSNMFPVGQSCIWGGCVGLTCRLLLVRESVDMILMTICWGLLVVCQGHFERSASFFKTYFSRDVTAFTNECRIPSPDVTSPQFQCAV